MSQAHSQTLLPVVSGSGVLSIAAPQYPGVTLSVTYLVRAGAPAALEARSEHSTASSFTEKATVPFRAKVTLYDRKDNLCVDYNGKIYLSLKLDNTHPSSPPAGITATSVLTSTVNQTVSPITITSGQGVSTAAFNVVKVPNVAASEVRPRIVIDGVVTGTGIAAGLSIKNPVFIDIIPGPPVLTLMRNSSGGLGSSWESLKSAGTPFNVDLLANQQYQFYPAGYDAGGNFAGEVPSNFWGINLNLDPANPVSSGLTAFLPTLNASDPNAFGLQANCPNPNITPVPGVSDATNQPLTNRVYCGLHRGLGIRQGTGTTFGSVGIPGTGRIIAAPLDPTIAYSVTPLLTTTAGVATRFSFELQDASTTVVLTSPVSASRPFKIFIHAQDNNNIDYTGYTGPKDFNVVSTAAESWGGVVPVLPNGTVNCTFVTGVCEFPGIYSVSDSRVPASITIEQITAGGVPGPWSKLISAALGPDAYLYFASKKGGPVASASAMTPAGFSTGIAMTADQEQAFGVSVTDASGNWKRDADNTADQLVFEGFDSAAGSLSSIFTPSTGAWSQVPWTSSYTVSNLFVANGAPIDSLPVTGKKFFDPGVAGDQASILGAGNIDPAKYNIVLVPQNRIGSGYAVIKSLANAALKSWPSPWFKISAGAIEHVDYKLVRIGNPARNNTNVLAGECNDIRIFIHDKKHNQLKDYTTTTNIALKLFKTDGSHPNGLDDPKAGDFSWISAMQAGTQSNDFYFAGNKSEVPGPYNSGFSIAGVDYRAGGRFAGVALSSAQNPLGVMSDWWSGAVSVIAGEIIQPGQLCLMSGQAVTNYNLASPSDTRLLQVDIPSTTINGTTYGAMTSRGANIQYNGASGATVGSTATAHSVSNVFTVFRDGPDHLHATWIDSVMGSQLIGSPGKTYGVGPSGNSPKVSAESATAFVDNNCPFLTPEVDPLTGSVLKFCGSKTVYWHTHDLGHNYIKPGSQAGFILGQSGFDPSTLAVGSPGSLGSPSIVILPSAVNRKIVPSYAGLVVGNTELPITQSAIGGSMGLTYQPGAPQAIVATRIGTPSFETTSPFGFSIKLVDQFGNLTGTGSGPTADPYHQAPYQTSRTLKAFWSATPSNAPSGASPILFGLTTGIHNSLATAFSDAFVNIPQVYLDTDATKQSYLPKSGQTSVLNLSIIDDSTTAWCAVPGNCTATGVQTYNLAVSLTPAAGPAAAT
ncbi:MAG: hypothetical protein NTV34_16225, partial [Proteobacteria bacterium]|nr:hypothetical protein [Pseudomonadota bacterium]